LDRFVDSLKKWPVFSTWDSYATQKMGESSGQRWTILWIIMHNQFFTIKPRISEKERRKQSCTPNIFQFYFNNVKTDSVWTFTCCNFYSNFVIYIRRKMKWSLRRVNVQTKCKYNVFTFYLVSLCSKLFLCYISAKNV